ADQIVGKTVADARPVIAAVGRLVDTAFARRAAADDRPRPPLGAPRAGVHLVGVLPVDGHRHDAGLFVDEQHLLPGLAAVFGPVDAALRTPAERIADGSDVGDVWILRMNLELADLSDVRQSRGLPRASRIR